MQGHRTHEWWWRSSNLGIQVLRKPWLPDEHMSTHRHMAEMTFVSEFDWWCLCSNSWRNPGLRFLVTTTSVTFSFIEVLFTVLFPHTHQPIWVWNFASGFWNEGHVPQKVRERDKKIKQFQPLRLKFSCCVFYWIVPPSVIFHLIILSWVHTEDVS